VCVADYAAGFKVDKADKSWRPATFKTEEKYIVKKSKDSEDMFVTKLGDKYSSFVCDARDPDLPYIRCSGFGDFFMNYENGRFEARGPHAFAITNKVLVEGENDVWMEIGKCSPL